MVYISTFRKGITPVTVTKSVGKSFSTACLRNMKKKCTSVYTLPCTSSISGVDILAHSSSRSYTTLTSCFAFGCEKKEVLAVKKLKSSLSSSWLLYPLLMLLLPVICGDGSSLRDSLCGSSGDKPHHSRLQGWEVKDGLGARDHRFR